MAEDIRNGNSACRDLKAAKEALAKECRDEKKSCQYTSTSFYIFMRDLKIIRVILWVVAIAASVAAANSILRGIEDYRIIVAGLTILGIALPTLMKTIKLDETITKYEKAASLFKNVEAELRRAAEIGEKLSYEEMQKLADPAFENLKTARNFSLTPPECYFKAAERKIKKGDYDPD